MARTVKTWNPAFLKAPDGVKSNIRPFVTTTIPDTHEHHPNTVDTGECPDCGAFTCELCGSDQHSTSEGHDLSNPRYWGV